MAIFRAAFTCLLLLPVVGQAEETTPPHFGPLLVQSQAPLQITGLTPILQDPFLLDAGQSDFFASATIGSVWANTQDYQLDYYHNQFMAGLLHALDEQRRVGIWLQYRYAANNRLDGLTETFHRIFGIDQNGRTEVDEDRFYIDIPDTMDTPAEDFVGDPIVSAINLYGEQTLYQTMHHAVSAGVTLFFNRVSHGVFANTSFEQSAQINYGYRRDKHCLTASMALVHRPDKPQHFIAVRPWGVQAGLSYQYRWFEHHELIAEYHLSQGKGDDPRLSDLNAPVHEVALGYRYLFGSSALELVALENMFNHDNSTDIVFNATFRHRFL